MRRWPRLRPAPKGPAVVVWRAHGIGSAAGRPGRCRGCRLVPGMLSGVALGSRSTGMTIRAIPPPSALRAARLPVSCHRFVGTAAARWPAALLLGFVVFVPPPVVADGVDVVTIAKHGAIRGRIVRREADGTLTLVVRRAWLAEAAPALEREAARDDRVDALAAREDVRRRIEATLATLPEGDKRRTFLETESARIERLLADPAKDPAARAPFTWLRLPARSVKREQAADPAVRRIVGWAWAEGLDGAETRPAERLRRDLVALGIDPAAEPPALADRLPPLPQDDRTWQARLALLADALDGPVTFQGVGDLQVRRDQAADAATILPLLQETLGGSLESLLGGLGGARPAADPWRWVASARGQADAAGRFRATRLNLDPQARRVTIESVFQVRLSDGAWETVWFQRRDADGTRPRPQAGDRLRGDPRIATALDAIRAVGLVDERQIEGALATGAATLEALAATDGAFAEFRSLHARALDGPPLWWDGR